MTAAAPHGLPGHLVGFVEALRKRGIPVGPSETVDAGQVMSVLDLLDREILREGLACALLRRPAHRDTFDGLFDLWFPVAIGYRTTDDDDLAIPRTESGTVDMFALRKMIAEMLTEDSPKIDQIVGMIVDQLGTYESLNGPSFSAYQALRDIAPDSLLKKILDGLLAAAGETDDEGFAGVVARNTAQQRIAGFRSAVESETRRRSAEKQGRDRVANYGVARQAEEVDFLRASDAELTKLRRSVATLAHLLATRLAARRRKARAGEIDLRKTLRKSMSTGGVPIDLVQRKPRPGRPELVIMCDVSGSVAGFSHFTLLLVHALREQFSRVRIFAFIDSADEVTDYFGPDADLGKVMVRMVGEAKLITYDGHSDYGNAFGVFIDQFRDSITDRTSLLILGDARTNYRDPNLTALGSMVDVAKHAHWLNPEPRNQWGSGDSAADKYGEVIEMHECRSAKQLTSVVAGLLPI
ncbi:vWA domain-containing protein [Antrihabitans cavernicola]|uniref:VWA domain-containing protein n=1 Tax=Antrihabitans cavernicola TaxID=2495913 RepID=A0A5A7SFE0_9NOCA|nr:VWA domain-containing protein [Spelaeibacter cavernicola]KAA0022951.1 VWA domain-containing protein [Spelaeibacter cavernicola]